MKKPKTLIVATVLNILSLIFLIFSREPQTIGLALQYFPWLARLPGAEVVILYLILFNPLLIILPLIAFTISIISIIQIHKNSAYRGRYLADLNLIFPLLLLVLLTIPSKYWDF